MKYSVIPLWGKLSEHFQGASFAVVDEDLKVISTHDFATWAVDAKNKLNEGK